MRDGFMLAGVLFALGLIGVLVRSNLIFTLMSIEVMLNAAGLAFVVAGARWGQPDGQVMFLFILAMAAAEVSVGLALVLRTLSPVQVAGYRRHQRDEGLRCSICSGWFRQSPSRALWCSRYSGRGCLTRASRRWVSGAVAASAIISILIAAAFLSAPPASGMYTQTLWTWIDVGSFRPQIAFYLDALSLVMMLVVTFVSFLIHLYSAEFMRDDEGYSRFFAYMNLFVASMVTLLLANNLLLLYLGWEGVGLCSYLLIGFWYQDPVNGRAGRKAFIVTRVGDTAMAIGLFLLVPQPGDAPHPGSDARGAGQWSTGSAYAIAAAALLLGGAVGKSAQLPLQTWLPDAMAGPTPTSALIHAATMVTAGVYLIARTHVTLRTGAAGAVRSRRDRRRHSADGRLQRADAKRYQARSGVFHGKPDRLHVPGAGRWRMGRRHLPFHDARVLQGSAVPGSRHHDRGAAPRARHLSHGRTSQGASSRLLDFPDRAAALWPASR